MLAKKKKAELEKKQAEDPQNEAKKKVLDALLCGEPEEEKKL